MLDKNVTLKFENVKIEEFNFNELDEHFVNQFEIQFLKVGLEITFSNNIEYELISCTIHITYEYKETCLLSCVTKFDYRINNLASILISEKNTLKIPDYILEKTTALSISSIRGIIIAKTEGSFINKFYLPLFDSKKIVSENNSF